MKKISTFIILSAVFVLCTSMSGCEDSSYRVFKVTIENESDDSIYYVINNWLEQSPLSPQVCFEEIPILGERMRSLAAGEKDEDFKVQDNGVNDFLGILIFKKSTMDKYTKKELVEKNIYDKQYTLFYEDLKKMDFRIIYTGE